MRPADLTGPDAGERGEDLALRVPDPQLIPEAGPRHDQPERGPVTNLPMPRYVSMKASKGNARRGPSRTHKIDWVYVRKDQPLEITAEFGHWRRVRDHEGLGGWVHYSLLSGVRTVLVEADEIPLHSRANDGAPLVAKLQRGVVAKLGDCSLEWCRLSVSGYKGWAHKDGLWGVDADEVRD
ncbi:SH3 domain-containing protein [Pseudooceanicola sp. 502str34]